MKARLYQLVPFFLLMAVALSCDEDDALPPQAAATFAADKTSARVGEEIQFTNNSTNATAFRWSFGDGTTSKEISPKKAYENSGTYMVTLLATGAGGSTLSNQEVTVVPNAMFAVENEESLTALTAVQFVNTSAGATSYTWTFGDQNNSTSTAPNPTFTYLTPGTYTVTLTATASTGETVMEKQIVVNSAPDELYYVDYSEGLIQKLSLDGNGTISTFLDINGKGGVGLAYDDVNGKIYFSDFEVFGEGKIWRVNIDGTGLEEIVSGLIEPYGIALDVAAGKIYWVDEWDENDNYIGHVSRANLDGSGREDLVSLEGQFRSIALDPENDKMYFYEVYYEELYVAGMDGSNPTPIVTGVYGYAIAVDTVNDKIYFDDQNDAQLKRANLDGTNVEMVDDTDTRIYGIVVDNEENKLYWSGRDSQEIYRADFDGSNQETLTGGLGSPRGIIIRK